MRGTRSHAMPRAHRPGRAGPAIPPVSCALMLLVVAAAAPGAAAQEPDVQAGDTAAVHALAPIVVTVSRSAVPVSRSTATVARLTAEELERLPTRSVADALQRIPGLAFLDFSGTARDPHLTTRGFYGGGESEYVVVLLDGRPVNDLEGGRVDWNLVPLSAIERIEVLRGGASALYGDAAVAAVVNLITRADGDDGLAWRVAADDLGSLRAEGVVRGRVAERAVSAFARTERSAGFRDHSDRRVATAGARASLLEGDGGRLRVATLHRWREFAEPGPLAGDLLARDRSQASTFHRFDRTEQRLHRLSLVGGTDGETRLSGYLTGELTRSDEIRTLPLAPDFADTKARDRSVARLLGSAQLDARPGLIGADDRLVAGADASLGRMSLDYYDILAGPADAYAAGDGSRGEGVASGEARRRAAGVFARYEFSPLPAVRVQAGARLDWIGDGYTPRAPGDGARVEADHLALSPRVGINVRHTDSPGREGGIHASVGRSFKAPTIAQLFDPRPIPVPVPPFAVTISNELLEPQHGVSAEAGLFQRAALGAAFAAELTLSAYGMRMRDELDFDLERFQYVNIGRSRHLGLEAGLKLAGAGGLHAFANYTLQDVTARNGDFAGKRLKAIPRHVAAVGAGVARTRGLQAAVTATRNHGIWLDDANTIELPGHTRVDARASYPVAGLRVSLEVFNLFDHEYSTTGYPDPAGSDVVYYYPAPGRTLQLTVSGR